MRALVSSSGIVADLEEGSGPLVAFLSAMGGGRAEWRPVGAAIRAALPDAALLAYDRPGYGDSRPATGERDPEAAAAGLAELLEELFPGRRAILAGHSLGGLYALAAARARPDLCAGLVLVDPLTPWDREFSERLAPEEFAASGADKSAGLRIGAALGRLGLLGLLRGMLAASPPLSLRKDWEREDKKEVLRLQTRAGTYRTALEEYRLAREPGRVASLGKAAGYPAVPLRLLVHSPATMIREIVEYGRAGEETAARVEALWRGLFERLLGLFPDSRLVEARKGSHYLQLEEEGLLVDAIAEIAASGTAR